VGSLRLPILLTAVASVLLAVRFLSGVALVAMDLTNEAGRVASAALEVYEVGLAIFLVLLVAFFALRVTPPPEVQACPHCSAPVRHDHLPDHVRRVHPRETVPDAVRRRPWAWIAILLLVAALSVWLWTPRPVFAVAGVLALIAVAAVGLRLRYPGRVDVDRWSSLAFLAFLSLLPLAFSMRSAAGLGLVSGVGTGGWLFVNAPTLLLELFSIGVWMNLAMGAWRTPGPRWWLPFLPFLLVPPLLFLFEGRPLAGFILSAVITWGANLPLFVPVLFALGLAVTAVACYVSSLLLLPRGPRRRLLALGAALAVLGGYYMSMASVAGLALALLTVSLALGPDPEVGT